MNRNFVCINGVLLIVLSSCSPYTNMYVINVNGEPVSEEEYAFLNTFGTDVYSRYGDNSINQEIKKLGSEHVYAKHMFIYYTYWSFHKIEDRFIPIRTVERVYLYDTETNSIVFSSTEFVDLVPFSEGKAAVRGRQETRCGYIDEQGKMVIDSIFDSCGSFYQGMAVVGIRQGGSESIKYGVIDYTGKYVIEPEFSEMYYNTDGLFPVIEHRDYGIGRSGIIDKNSDFVLQLATLEEVASPIINDKLLVRYPEGYKLVNVKGDTIVDFGPKWNQVYPMQNNRALVRSKRSYTYIDITGNVAIPAKYSIATPFFNGRAVVNKRRLF